MVIQRIQSLFLLIAAVLMAAFAFFPAFEVSTLVLIILISALAIVDIFLYKNLQRQMTVCFVDIIIGLAMLIAIIVQAVKLYNAGVPVTWSWNLLLPILSVVFLMLAHNAMSRDKKKLRDSDRLR